MAVNVRLFVATLALLPALLLGSSSANAAGTAAASISNVRFGVLDLTPEDGAAAGYDIRLVTPSLFANLYGDAADYYAAGYPDPLRPATVQLSLGETTVSAHASGMPGGVASTATADTGLGSYGMAGGSANEAVHFTLRPWTVLTIGGHLSALATRAAAPGEYYDVAGMAYIGIVDGNGYTFTQFTRQSLAFADWPDRMAIDEDFMLAFANGGTEDRDVSVYFQALSNVTRIATPVPEPSTVMLLCAGLLLAGCRAVACRHIR